MPENYLPVLACCGASDRALVLFFPETMAFWGIEVKPGKPFIHKFDDLKGRLHVSMATLGFGTATTKSILQCNVGNKSPVYLCSLYPGNSESLQLNLEFEEADEVILSVIGPRSVHLSGYYLGSRQNSNLIEESESYGEDIADTETERSQCSDEDKYDDSFIDDTDPEIFSQSPISSDERPCGKRPKKGKGTRGRLVRKYQPVESDNEECFEQNHIVDGSTGDQVMDSDTEDKLPISSLHGTKATDKDSEKELEENNGKGQGETINKKANGDVNDVTELGLDADNVLGDSLPKRGTERPLGFSVPCDDVSLVNVQKPKKKKKENKRKAKNVEANDAFPSEAVKLDNTQQDESEVDQILQDIPSVNGQNLNSANDKGTDLMDEFSVPSTEVGAEPESGEKPKKRRKEGMVEKKYLDANGSHHGSVFKEDESQTNEIKSDDMVNNLPQKNQECQKDTIDKGVELEDKLLLPSTEIGPGKVGRTKRKRKERENEGSALEGDTVYHKNVTNEDNIQEYETKSDGAAGIANLPKGHEKNLMPMPSNEKRGDNEPNDFPQENQSTNGKVKKMRKKKSKIQENEEALDMYTFPLIVEQKSIPVKEDENKKADAKPSQIRTLSNGLIIQELELGKPDGKIAVSGRKVSISYVGKLKNGEVIDSNVGEVPFKFRLGKGQVINGWDVGLEGMRVGEKRKLTVPPSMGFGSEGHAENIPPNSWLVYDVELVKVR